VVNSWPLNLIGTHVPAWIACTYRVIAPIRVSAAVASAVDIRSLSGAELTSCSSSRNSQIGVSADAEATTVARAARVNFLQREGQCAAAMRVMPGQTDASPGTGAGLSQFAFKVQRQLDGVGRSTVCGARGERTSL
jgi:hypothetical protein